MSRPRILTLFGTRPEAVKLSPVLRALSESEFESLVCCTGQHESLVEQAMESLDIQPDVTLHTMNHGQSLGKLTSLLFDQVDSVLTETRPDWVLVHGDTTSAFVAGVAAFYHRIRIGHVEAGLRTGDLSQPFPEEFNRMAIGRVADLHFAPTQRAGANLRREGVPDERIHITGNTVVDAVRWISPQVDDQASPRVRALIEDRPQGTKFLLVTTHRRESFGSGIRQTCAALREIADAHPSVHIILVTHLNPNMREPVHEILGGYHRITLIEPVDYFSLLYLMKCSYLILTDSGGIQEEAPAFGKPVLVLRNMTERPEGVEAGSSLIVGTDKDLIVRETSRLLVDQSQYESMVAVRNPYGDGKAGVRIASLLKDGRDQEALRDHFPGGRPVTA